MKILYGVCGEGFGNSSRAYEMITRLRADHHHVLVLTYGQAVQVLSEFPLIEVAGLTISFQQSKIAIRDTLIKNTKALFENIKDWKAIQKKIDRFAPNLCITDMDPIIPIVSHSRKLPLISIDNQHRLTHLPLEIPQEYMNEYLLAKTFVHRCVAKADAFIILSFAKQEPNSENAYVVSPILRGKVKSLTPHKGKGILVYQTKPDSALLEMLQHLPHQFTVYGYNKDAEEGNITYRKTGPRLLDDLPHAQAIIGTAGFTLISESLYLKKPYLALPLKGQFEQMLNALHLKKAGFGTYLEELEKEKIEAFLSNIPQYEENLQQYRSYPNEAYDVLQKVLTELEIKV